MHNTIGQTGANAIAAALASNTTLTTLQLTQYGKTHTDAVRAEINAALERNKKLANDSVGLFRIDIPDHIAEIYSVYRTH